MSARKRFYFDVTLFFRVEGIEGRQDYAMAARDRGEALRMAWSALHWEALDLDLVDLGERNKSIAYRARITPTGVEVPR